MAAVRQEMLADCERKAGEVMLNLLRKATSAVAPDPKAAPGLFYECVRLHQEAKVNESINWACAYDFVDKDEGHFGF